MSALGYVIRTVAMGLHVWIGTCNKMELGSESANSPKPIEYPGLEHIPYGCAILFYMEVHYIGNKSNGFNKLGKSKVRTSAIPKLGEMPPAAAETLLVDVEWQCPFTEKERRQHIYWYQLNYDSSEMAIEGILGKV